MSPDLLAAAAASANDGDAGRLLIAVLLLLAAVALAVIEFVVVSMGLLTLAALGCATGAVLLAFSVSPLAGWWFVMATAVAAVGTLIAGLGLLRRLTAGPSITAAAGYAHQVAGNLMVGADGILLTDAWPTGRARFGDAELHVSVAAGGLPRGSAVRVLHLDGAVITVCAIT
jgi:membrane-bound serine protease (ClpP class)